MNRRDFLRGSAGALAIVSAPALIIPGKPFVPSYAGAESRIQECDGELHARFPDRPHYRPGSTVIYQGLEWRVVDTEIDTMEAPQLLGNGTWDNAHATPAADLEAWMTKYDKDKIEALRAMQAKRLLVADNDRHEKFIATILNDVASTLDMTVAELSAPYKREPSSLATAKYWEERRRQKTESSARWAESFYQEFNTDDT